MASTVDILIINAAQVLTMDPNLTEQVSDDPEAAQLGVIANGAVALGEGKIAAVGPTPSIQENYAAKNIIDATNCIVTPGLVDPHTHLVFAGSRHLEYGMRMRGSTYHEILRAGGGIHSTVKATREAPLETLINLARPRLTNLLHFGVTTAEVKSGYGLDRETELKILKAIQKLDEQQPVRLVPTYLGAHVVPLEYREKRETYVSLITAEMIPAVAQEGLAEAVDVFLDEGAFTRAETTKILNAAQNNGLRVKVHAGQFTDQGGPELIAELGGLSADHLEVISDRGIEAMARAGVVANLLPGAAFSLRDHFPDGRRLIDGGVQVALATDDNPGTSRTENLPLMAAMGVTQMGLTAAEAWQGITVHAAKALGRHEQVGSLVPGMIGDVAIFSVPDFRAFLYHFGHNHTATVIINGKIAVSRNLTDESY